MTDDLRLDDWLDEWFAMQRTRLEPATWRSYHDMADFYLRPGLGGLTLPALTVRLLERHYVHLLEHGGRRGGGLSRRTVAYAHAVLHKALSDAVRLEVLSGNVAERVTLPRIDARTDTGPARLRVWDAAQVRRFLELTADDELHDLWRVALGTGMRRGELLGLRHADLDLRVPQLQVASALTIDGAGRPRLKRPKTGRPRTLHLDDHTAAALARHPPRPGAELPTVFLDADGRAITPPQLTSRWRSLVRTLPLPPLRLHDLRHTHATLLLQRGVPIKVVSERLGHSTIAMTMDVYAHVLPAMDRDAADAIGSLFAEVP